MEFFIPNGPIEEILLDRLKAYKPRYDSIYKVLHKLGKFNKSVVLYSFTDSVILYTAYVIDNDNNKFVFATNSCGENEIIDKYEIKKISLNTGYYKSFSFLDDKNNYEKVSNGYTNDFIDISLRRDSNNQLRKIICKINNYKYELCILPMLEIDIKGNDLLEELKNNIEKINFTNFYNIISKYINPKECYSFDIKEFNEEELLKHIDMTKGKITAYEENNTYDNHKEKIYLKDGIYYKETLVTNVISSDDLNDNIKKLLLDKKRY